MLFPLKMTTPQVACFYATKAPDSSRVFLSRAVPNSQQRCQIFPATTFFREKKINFRANPDEYAAFQSRAVPSRDSLCPSASAHSLLCSGNYVLGSCTHTASVCEWRVVFSPNLLCIAMLIWTRLNRNELRPPWHEPRRVCILTHLGAHVRMDVVPSDLNAPI